MTNFTTSLQVSQPVHLADVLENNGIMLFPTDTLWMMGCYAFDQTAVRRLLHLKQALPGTEYEVLCDSIEMVKSLVPNLHPRIETLWHFHQRPLAVQMDGAIELPQVIQNSKQQVSIRIVTDTVSKAAIQAAGGPLFATFANIVGTEYALTYGAISSAILENVDYVVKMKQNDKTPGTPAVLATLNDRSELVFLRE